MDDKERNIIEQIQKKMDNVIPPANLEPSQIEKLLKENSGHDSMLEFKSESKSKRKGKKILAFGLLAACLAVTVFGVLAVQKNLFKKPSGGDVVNIEQPREERNEDSMESSESMESAAEEPMDSIEPANMAMAKDYDEVYQYIERMIKEEEADTRDGWGINFGSMKGEMVFEEAATADEAPMAEPAAGAQDQGGSFSETNLREEGVDEADYVKTNGKNIYAKKDNGYEIGIVSADSEEMEVVGTIELDKKMQIEEFFLQQNKIIILCNSYPDSEYYYGTTNTAVITYDISNPEKPKLVGENSQSGGYYSSRIVDGYLYVLSQYYVDVYAQPLARNLESYIPAVNDELIASTNIMLPPMQTANMYMVITGVSVDEPEKIVDEKAIFLKYNDCYVSQEAIYFYEEINDYRFTQRSNETVIRKVNYKDGKITPTAQGEIRGSIHDSFCIDEYEGNLRVVTTTYKDWEPQSNSVYVLDEKLEVIGSIVGLAKEERIYSARLMGETGYFVTYRETDPLFSVDFSDPQNPTILGELKIPGFSEYLHFYGDGLLLGIGMHTNDPDSSNEPLYTEGVKISMFDISDPTDVKEKDKYIIDGAYYSDVFYDYKAVLIDVNRNIIGFTASGVGEDYYIFSYDKNNGFNLEAQKELLRYYGNTRALYVEDRLYIAKGNVITCYSLKDYRKLAVCTLTD